MDIKELLGKTMVSFNGGVGCSEIIFTTTDGEKYKFYHSQECCEQVRVEDICGEMSDLVGSPITQAEENSSGEDPPGVTQEHQDTSFTWTFYRFATAKGQVVIRWYGESNGYYSTSVGFKQVS